MNRKNIMMTLAFAVAIGMKAQTEVAALQNVYARQTMSLNGEWNYFVDLQEQGYYDYRMNPTQWGYFINAKPKSPSDLVEYDFDACPTLHVPGDWNTQDPQLFLYEGTIWMKKDFIIDHSTLTIDHSEANGKANNGQSSMVNVQSKEEAKA